MMIKGRREEDMIEDDRDRVQVGRKVLNFESLWLTRRERENSSD